MYKKDFENMLAESISNPLQIKNRPKRKLFQGFTLKEGAYSLKDRFDVKLELVAEIPEKKEEEVKRQLTKKKTF